jgi:hypothetical protein
MDFRIHSFIKKIKKFFFSILFLIVNKLNRKEFRFLLLAQSYTSRLYSSKKTSAKSWNSENNIGPFIIVIYSVISAALLFNIGVIKVE